jgi:hypothetical protein
MGMRGRGIGARRLGLALAWLMTLQVGAAQAADACRAVFSGGLQTRGSGSINFQWGSQLSGNPGNLLDTTQVRSAWGSASCGSSDCKASGWPAGDLGGIPWPKIMAQHDLHVGYLGSAEAGGAGVNHFRQIQVDGSGELVFSNSHQDYYIEQLSLAYGARVTLAPGRYWIGRLEMAGNTQLRLASGSAKVIVGSNLTLPFQASINAPEGAPGRADALQLFVRGDLQQDSSSRISGLAYVEGDYRAAFAAVLRGAVNARGVDLATAARVETDQPAINSAIWNIQCSERRDLDGDGLIDLFDPDADGDGYDDEQERLAGSDPFDAGGIPQVTPGGTTGDLCVAAFAKGLQTHGKGGTIRFGWNAQLRDAPSSYLPALQVDRTLGSTARSCGSQDCQPSFSGAPAPALPAFRTSTDGFNQSVPFAGQVRLDGSRKQWGRLDLGGLSRTTLNAPGEYRLRELNLGYQAVLELAPGDYWIERLTIGSAARIQPIGNGTVRLHVRSDLELPWQAMLNATGPEQPGQASRLLVLGEGNVTLASGTTVGGFIYARGNLAQQVGALLFGGAVATNIALDSMARTHHRPDDLSRLDFGLLCDLDGDGIGDGQDDDRDGDGYSNDDEIKAGTNPDDPASVPADLDKDGIPDALDDDRDGDGVLNVDDALPDDPKEWKDLDGDGIGDNADPDRDGDGISNEHEIQLGTNPDDATSFPPDLDKDGIPDALDIDRDGDGVPNDLDAFPDDPNEWRDLDGDGIGDNADPDRDGDGISNDYEVKAGTNPDDAASVPADLDKDGIPDVLDDDRDGDGVLNVDDAFPDDPKEWKDLDGDGIGDNADPDRDGDGISNDDEIQLGTNPDDPRSVPADLDKDGIPDALDDDRDGDGVANAQDAFPDDPKEWKDLDGDGIGDNADPDRDGDGISNDYELQAGTNPDDASSVPPDMDKDGIPDSLDDDRDGDGVANAQDAFPDDPKEWKDLDGDGIGDNADPDRDGDGVSNADEIAAGTNPDDPLDFPDRVAPEVVIDGPPVLSVNEDSVSLSGSASDAQSGVASLEFASDRFPGSRFAVTLDKGVWRASVPLLEGTNLLTLTATDKAGNGSTRILTVERLPLASDIGLTLDYPQQGATLTDARLVVRGTLRSDKAAQRLEVQVNGQPATVTPTAQATEFTFQSAPIVLQQGGNTLTVQAWVDQRSLQRSLQVSYLPPQTSFKPPRFENLSPADGAQLPGSTFYLSGQLIAEAGLERVTLNGRSLTLREAGAQLLDLREALSIPNGQDSYSAELIARDKAGQESRATLRWQLDRQAPEIVLDRPLVELPARNRVSEQPFPVSGTLRERNPASFQINGNDVALQPGNAEGELRFATRLALPIGSSASLVLEASDQAGNRLRREYSLELAAQAAIGWVLPTEGTELLDLGEPINLQVAARIDDLSGQLLPRVLLQDAAGTTLAQSPLSGATTLKSATVQLPGAGQYNLVAQLLDGAGQVLAQSARAVSVIRPQQAPLALERVSPANGERNIEPNQFISLYFNQSVNVAKLQVKVYETAHGKTYADLDELGTSELQAAGYQLVDVNRDYAPVVGNLSQLPGGQIIAFYPEKDLSYDGEVSVEVRYDGEELERLRFRTRTLPTLVSGVLLDQLQQPVADVEVRLAELNRSVRTNRDGGFNFGYAERAEDNIPGGAYTLQLNPDLEQRSYASDSRRVTLQQGVRNDLGRWQLTQLSAGLPFVPLRGGAQFSLLDGELKLDLGNARLFFPDGRQTGDVHAQMLQFSELPYPVEPLALPYWMYSVQPAGIRVDGQFSVDLAALKLGDGYDYLPENGSYVTLVGFDSQARRIVPVGVGLIQDLRIRSQGDLALDNLDYIGFALADANVQPALKAYAAGEINLRQLQAELYRFTQAR